MLSFYVYLCGALIGCLCLTSIVAQPDGWRMVDRFHGFRYELSGRNLDTASILETILNEADNYACFGWAQVSPAGTIVGEARCGKSRGKVFQEKLKTIHPQITKADILVCLFYSVLYFAHRYLLVRTAGLRRY